MDNMSVCGTDCPECYCYAEKMCPGCNECAGRVFHCGGVECAIYHCCKDHGFGDCGECDGVPCDIWRKTRDPKFSDEEFEKNIAGRIANLRSKYNQSGGMVYHR